MTLRCRLLHCSERCAEGCGCEQQVPRVLSSPADELDKVGRQLDASSGIHNGGVVVAGKVRRHHRLVSVTASQEAHGIVMSAMDSSHKLQHHQQALKRKMERLNHTINQPRYMAVAAKPASNGLPLALQEGGVSQGWDPNSKHTTFLFSAAPVRGYAANHITSLQGSAVLTPGCPSWGPQRQPSA